MSLWKEHYKLGVDQLDRQHRQLILELEDLLRVLADPACDHKKQARHAMDFTKNFTVVHFSAEEMYQKETGYAGYEAHKKKHEGFKETLHQMELKLIRDDYGEASVRAFADMLTRWWMYHIMNEDQKIVKGG